MRIIFFGTPGFAANNLQFLIESGYDIVAVVTATDSRKGRGKQLKATAVKKLALENNISVLQPENLKDATFIRELKSYTADLYVVVAFRMLPEIVWKIPEKGSINLHTSLLPNYRGAAPINRVLINGENKTGITTFFIDQQIDSGAIIMQEEVELSKQTTAAQLHNILMEKGSVLLHNTVHAIERNLLSQKVQNHDTTMQEAPKLTKELLKIDWTQSADDIHNLVRGLSPYLDANSLLKDVAICPSAWFTLQDENRKDKRIKLQLTKIESTTKTNRLAIDTDNKSYFTITLGDKALSILNLQAEGKNPMSIAQFLQGNKLNENFKIL